MRSRVIAFYLLIISLLAFSKLNAQAVYCPPNIDFEFGNFTNWQLYTGSCCPINTPVLSGAVANRHTITTGLGVDPYGGFPIVMPGSGSYSLKLGNNINGAQAERARYYVHIPVGLNNYSLIFRYAVVFENPNHQPAQQPRFEVKAYDSITNNIVNCSQFIYVSTSGIPGFSLSTLGSNVWYKPWTTASIDLTGYAGRTVVVDFASGDCSLGGHFGYGYVDIGCGLFQISAVACANSPITTLTAPPGYAQYIWKDSALTTTIATGQIANIPTPPVTTTYAVILVPYTGFGCADTLYSTVTVSDIVVNAGRDTGICAGTALQMSATVTGSDTPLTYSWSPSTSLSCSNCLNPIATPLSTTRYILTVTNSIGCAKKDTVDVRASSLAVSLTKQNVTCYGLNNGSLTSVLAGGTAPFIRSWNTTPAQTGVSITNLSPRAYTITVTDSIGCIKTATDTITEPALLVDTTTSITNVKCYKDSTGAITVGVKGGTLPYTYSWNIVPVKTTAAITGLKAGTYISTVTDAKGCTAKDTVIITQPDSIMINKLVANVQCFGFTNGAITTITAGGTAPYLYSWNTTPAATSPSISGLAAGTYIVTVTDTNGCIKKDTTIITQPTAINLSLTKQNVSCFGLNNGSLASTITGGILPYSRAWNTTPVQSGVFIINLSPRAYTLTVTDGNGCIKTATDTITEPALLVDTTTNVTNVKCYKDTNGTITIGVKGGTLPYTYSWNTTPVKTTPAITGLKAGTYISTVTDANGCTAKDTIVINQPDSMIIARSVTNVQCFGFSNGAISTVTTGGTSPYRYSWNTAPVRTTASISGLTSGTYIITVTDINGCTKNDTTTITQPTAISITLTKQNVSCFGLNNGSLASTVTGGTLPYSRAWNTVPVQSGVSVINLSPRAYTLTVTDGNGCIKTATDTITEPALLVDTTTSVTNIKCYKDTNGAIAIGVKGGTLPYTYSWNTTPVKTTAAITGLKAGIYISTVTDAKGCTAKDTVVITEPGALVITKTKTNISCNGLNAGSINTSASGGVSPYKYSWNTIPAQTTASISGLVAGTYILTVSDTNNCIAKDTTTITQPTPLSDSLTKSDVRCYGESTGSSSVSTSGGTPPYSYKWNTIPTQITAMAGNLPIGTYSVIITDANNCKDTESIIINQPLALVIDANPVDSTCIGFNNGSAFAVDSGGVQPHYILWNSNPPQTTNLAKNLAGGLYTVIVTDANGCKDTATAFVENFPNPVVSVTPDKKICFGETVQLAASGANSFLWIPATYLSCDTCKNPIAKPKTTTGYIVIGANKYHCLDTANVKITVVPKLDVSVAPDTNICVGDAAQLFANGGIDYTWTPAGTLSNDKIANPLTFPATTTKYKVIVTENECFTDTLYQNVTVHELPTISLGPDLKGISGASLQLKADTTKAYRITWSPAEGLSCDNCINPVVTLYKTITYIATVYNDYCEAKDDIRIEVNCDGSHIFIPNSFTPNGDGNNDYFYPSTEGAMVINLFRVYNRWGQLLFEARNIPSNKPEAGWDGRFNNEILSPDVFVYYLEYKCPNNQSIFLKGDISLLR